MDANLSRANLENADMTRVDLDRTDLSFARLVHANLRGADHLTAMNLRGAMLAGAKECLRRGHYGGRRRSAFPEPREAGAPMWTPASPCCAVAPLRRPHRQRPRRRLCSVM